MVRVIRRYKLPLEWIGMALMILGMIGLVQPVSRDVFHYGFPVLLVGFLLYAIVSHF